MKALVFHTDIEERVVRAALEQTRQDMSQVLMSGELNCLLASSYEITLDTAHAIINRMEEAKSDRVQLGSDDLTVYGSNGSVLRYPKPLPTPNATSVSIKDVIDRLALVSSRQGVMPSVEEFCQMNTAVIDSLSADGLRQVLETLSYYTIYAQTCLTRIEDNQQHEAIRATWQQNPAPLQPVAQDEAQALARRGVSDLAYADKADRY